MNHDGSTFIVNLKIDADTFQFTDDSDTSSWNINESEQSSFLSQITKARDTLYPDIEFFRRGTKQKNDRKMNLLLTYLISAAGGKLDQKRFKIEILSINNQKVKIDYKRLSVSKLCKIKFIPKSEHVHTGGMEMATNPVADIVANRKLDKIQDGFNLTAKLNLIWKKVLCINFCIFIQFIIYINWLNVFTLLNFYQEDRKNMILK